MKFINKLEEINEMSPYSGQYTRNVEMYLRPIDKVDANGKELKASERYYVFRLLGFYNGDRNNYPFIVRHEHEFYRKDASNKIIEVKRICCPKTSWARGQIRDYVDNDYCPICKLSLEQNAEGWKNWKTSGQRDDACIELSKATQRKWAAYVPVLVVSDPSYPKRNNHLAVLRLSGNEGMNTLKLIYEKIKDAQERNISIFNAAEGANIAILCEKQQKLAVNKKNEPIIDNSTGLQKTYLANCVTDVRLLDKRLHSYPLITEAAIEKLRFDETYGVAATKEQLAAFMSENYLDTGASDADFEESEFSDTEDFDQPKVEITPQKKVEKVQSVESEDFGDDDSQESDDITMADLNDCEDESPREAIERITKSSNTAKAVSKPVEKKIVMKNKVELQDDTDVIRDSTVADFSEDDLPF